VLGGGSIPRSDGAPVPGSGNLTILRRRTGLRNDRDMSETPISNGFIGSGLRQIKLSTAVATIAIAFGLSSMAAGVWGKTSTACEKNNNKHIDEVISRLGRQIRRWEDPVYFDFDGIDDLTSKEITQKMKAIGNKIGVNVNVANVQSGHPANILFIATNDIKALGPSLETVLKHKDETEVQYVTRLEDSLNRTGIVTFTGYSGLKYAYIIHVIKSELLSRKKELVIDDIVISSFADFVIDPRSYQTSENGPIPDSLFWESVNVISGIYSPDLRLGDDIDLARDKVCPDGGK
jgi:hypothetical protein